MQRLDLVSDGKVYSVKLAAVRKPKFSLKMDIFDKSSYDSLDCKSGASTKLSLKGLRNIDFDSLKFADCSMEIGKMTIKNIDCFKWI